MSVEGTDQQKLTAIGEKTYKDQAVWFLNAFWEQFGQTEAERVWSYAHRMAEIDTQRRAQGNALDEFQAHQFLEQCKETLTVLQMREHIRSVGIEKVKLVPFIHYLIFRYKVDWHYLVNAPQGNPEEVAKAQRMLEEVQAALAAAQRTADEARRSAHEATKREAEAKRDEAEAKRTEEEAKRTEAESKRTEAEAQRRADELRTAQQEVETALAELHAQEQAYNNKTEELKRKSEEGSVVQRNKAKNELAQHLGEDPLPLRRAKITQEAAVKKADRATKAAEEAAAQAAQARQAAEAARREAEAARRQAEAARRAAEEARREAEEAREAAEVAVREAEEKLGEAEAYLEEVKAIAGNGKGALWWIDRELHEARAYMPTSKGGYKKEKNI